MVELSLKRTGVMFYLAKLYGLATGGFFVLIVTRNLDVTEFGAWGTISTLLSYAAVATFVNFWVTRLRASGNQAATTTALVLSAILAAPATATYVALSSNASSALKVPWTAVMVSAFYVPILYVNSALYASAYGATPFYAAVSEVVFETVKLTAALLATGLWGVNLEVALLSVLTGHLAQTVALIWSLREDLRLNPRMEVAKKVLALSWANVFSVVPSMISGLDVLLISALVSSESVAYYTVVLPFMNAVSYSYFLSRGLYPRLIASKGSEIYLLNEALRLVLLLALPSSIGVAVVAPNLLYVLKPEYSQASLTLRIAAFAAMVSALNGVLADAIQGVERADLEGGGFRELLKSKIVKVQAFSCAKSLAGVAGIAAVAFTLKDPLRVAVFSRGVWLAATVVELVILAVWAGAFPVLRNLAYAISIYASSSFTAALVAYSLNPLKIREVIATALLSASLYFCILYLLDPWFKATAHRAVSLVFKRNRRFSNPSSSQS